MSDDIFTRFYATTAGPDDKRVRDGCGHLHTEAGRAVACALERGDYPVVVARCGKSILPMDPALDAALAAALGDRRGGVAGRLAMRADGSGSGRRRRESRLPGGGVRCHGPH